MPPASRPARGAEPAWRGSIGSRAYRLHLADAARSAEVLGLDGRSLWLGTAGENPGPGGSPRGTRRWCWCGKVTGELLRFSVEGFRF